MPSTRDDPGWDQRPDADLVVGTSGFVYDDWRGPFYPRDLPQRRWLEAYAQAFPTVELNVTFYRLPPARTFEQWRDTTPPGFRFSVKASRYLTHVRRLRDPREPVERLMDRAGRLGDRLGAVLLQLPPDMRVDLERLDTTVTAFDGRVPLAVEPRHPSWFTDDLRRLLERRGVALCIADRRGPITPLWRTAEHVYVRLHTGRSNPPGCYGDAALRSWVDRLRDLGRPPGYLYFDNDGHACAVRDARTFTRMLARRWAGSPDG